ncbi:hypothetical protein ABZP36_001883 [Zizania latifolia]
MDDTKELTPKEADKKEEKDPQISNKTDKGEKSRSGNSGKGNDQLDLLDLDDMSDEEGKVYIPEHCESNKYLDSLQLTVEEQMLDNTNKLLKELGKAVLVARIGDQNKQNLIVGSSSASWALVNVPPRKVDDGIAVMNLEKALNLGVEALGLESISAIEETLNDSEQQTSLGVGCDEAVVDADKKKKKKKEPAIAKRQSARIRKDGVPIPLKAQQRIDQMNDISVFLRRLIIT